MSALSFGVIRVDQENSLTSLTLQDCGHILPSGRTAASFLSFSLFPSAFAVAPFMSSRAGIRSRKDSRCKRPANDAVVTRQQLTVVAAQQLLMQCSLMPISLSLYPSPSFPPSLRLA